MGRAILRMAIYRFPTVRGVGVFATTLSLHATPTPACEIVQNVNRGKSKFQYDFVLYLPGCAGYLLIVQEHYGQHPGQTRIGGKAIAFLTWYVCPCPVEMVNR